MPSMNVTFALSFRLVHRKKVIEMIEGMIVAINRDQVLSA